MKEVSCRVLDVFFREIQRKGLPAETLVRGVPYSVERLRRKHERIDWSSYVRFLANVRSVWPSDEDLEGLGGAAFRSPFTRPVAVVAGLLFSAREFYEWANAPGTGLGNQHFSCIRPFCRETEPTHMVLELSLAEGYEFCREFFVLTKGGLAEMPKLVGLGRAHVEMRLGQRGATYDIRYPSGGGKLSWLRRSMAWPLRARAAARELKEAYEILQERYTEIEGARAQLDGQATQLRTAHTISNVVHGDLDLDRTLDAVTRTLVEQAGFQAAEIELQADLEDQHVDRNLRRGRSESIVEPLCARLESRGHALGTLKLWPDPDKELLAQQQLLTYLAPTVSMAVANAITFTAVTDYRANLQQRVEQRTKELSQAKDSLAETVDRLREAQGTRDRIFANINHEVRTPLSLIKLATLDLQRRCEEGLGDRARQTLSGIDRNVDRLLHLVDGLLLLAAAQEEKLRVRPVHGDLAVLLQSLVSAWAPAAENAGVELDYRGPQRCGAHLDQLAIERIVANLLSNAIKFTPRNGSVEVALDECEGELQIVVTDTGVGIEEGLRERVFERFEQGTSTPLSNTRGSGLGLSIVKELVVAHGGDVSCAARSGGGTVFRVSLPRGAEDPAEAAPETPPRFVGARGAAPVPFAQETSTMAQQTDHPCATLLVAEDDRELRGAIVALLATEYRVLQAGDGDTALRLVDSHCPDLLLADIGMPGMDGLELARRFRDTVGNRLAPVVFLTAYADERHRMAGFEAGAVDYVVKPFSPDELRARVHAQLALRELALKLAESEKLASIGILSSGLAHEMRNPANAVVNAVGPLRERLPPEVLKPGTATADLLEVLELGAMQIERVSRSLLGFTRPGTVDCREEPVETLLNRSLTILKPRSSEVALCRSLSYRGSVRCCGPLVVQALVNLIDNAVQAAGADGWVEIATRHEGDDLCFEIADSGPGVTAEMRERIFEPFFTTKGPGVGSGLGLTTARRVAEQHSGTLRTVDGPKGTVFQLRLPLQGPRERKPPLDKSKRASV